MMLLLEPNIKELQNYKIDRYFDVVDKADLIFILVAHKEFKSLKTNGKRIFDFSSR